MKRALVEAATRTKARNRATKKRSVEEKNGCVYSSGFNVDIKISDNENADIKMVQCRFLDCPFPEMPETTFPQITLWLV
jgi:hypothetical protein